MDQLIESMRQQLAAMKARNEAAGKDPVRDIAQEQHNIQEDLSNFQNNIISLTKACITDLQTKNDKIVKMTGDVQEIEGTMSLIKDAAGDSLRPVLPEFNIEPGVPELDVPSEKPETIYLPSVKFAISLHVLDHLGPPLKELQDPENAPSLIRLVPEDVEMPVLWRKQADYFLMEPSRNPGDNITSFTEIYEIPSPSFEKDGLITARLTQKS